MIITTWFFGFRIAGALDGGKLRGYGFGRFLWVTALAKLGSVCGGGNRP
jgi:hypothetical protein